MTNKMRLIFVIATSLSAAFSVLMSTHFAIDTADQLLSVVANALGLHEAPTLSALAVLVIPGLYLYLALGQRRHSVGEQNNGHRDRQ
jgi:type III secretory pathway component EscR